MPRLAPYLLGIFVVACSGREEIPTSTSSQATESNALRACYARCKTRSEASNCQPAGTSEEYCKDGCDALVPGLTESCQKKAMTAYACESKAAWACVENGVPRTMDAGCAAPNAEFAPCFEAQ